jgi:hypothetical protein
MARFVPVSILLLSAFAHAGAAGGGGAAGSRGRGRWSSGFRRGVPGKFLRQTRGVKQPLPGRNKPARLHRRTGRGHFNGSASTECPAVADESIACRWVGTQRAASEPPGRPPFE